VYCPKCREKAPAPVAATAPRKKTGSTGMFQAVKSPAHGTQRLDRGPATRGFAPVTGGTQRHPHLGHGTQRLQPVEPEPAGGGGKAPMVAGAVALVVLLGAGILFFVQNSKENAAKAAEAKRLADAKSAYEEAVKFRQANPDDPEGLLKLIEDLAKRARNSEWAGKLAAEAEDAESRRKVMQIRREREQKLEAARSKASASDADLRAIAQEIDGLAAQWRIAGDLELATTAGSTARSLRDSLVRRSLEDAKAYEAANPDNFEEVQKRLLDVMGLCAEIPGYEAESKQAQERLQAVKVRREAQAVEEFEQVKKKVETLRAGKKWDEAISELRGFVERRRGAACVDDAQRLAWDIEAEKKKAMTENPANPDPGKLPPAEWTPLWDARTQSGWKLGGSRETKWESRDGVMTGTNPLTPEDAKKDTQTNGVGFWYFDRAFSGYEVELDMTLVKGSGLVVVALGGLAKEPPAIPFRGEAEGTAAQVVVPPGKAVTMLVRVRADSVEILVNGAGRKWQFQGYEDGKDHGAGIFGLALSPQSEVQVRSAKIRRTP